MKKYFIALMIICIGVANVNAQTNGTGGVRRGGTSIDMRNKVKERVKTELSLSDAKTDSVAAIQQTYQYKLRSLKFDTNIDEESKKTKIAELESERKLKLKEVITDEQIIKLNALMANRKKIKQQNQVQPVVE